MYAARGEWACVCTFRAGTGSMLQAGFFECSPAAALFPAFRTRFLGNALCWSATSDDELRVWDVERGVCRHLIKFGQQFCTCAVAQQGSVPQFGSAPVLVCVCSSLEILHLLFVDLVYGTILSHSRILQTASQVRACVRACVRAYIRITSNDDDGCQPSAH